MKRSQSSRLEPPAPCRLVSGQGSAPSSASAGRSQAHQWPATSFANGPRVRVASSVRICVQRPAWHGDAGHVSKLLDRVANQGAYRPSARRSSRPQRSARQPSNPRRRVTISQAR